MSVFLIQMNLDNFNVERDIKVARSEEHALWKILGHDDEYGRYRGGVFPANVKEVNMDYDVTGTSTRYNNRQEVERDYQKYMTMVKPARPSIPIRSAHSPGLSLPSVAAAPLSPVMTPPLSPVRSPTLQLGAPPVGPLSPARTPITYNTFNNIVDTLGTVTNPKTGRTIAVGKATYNALIKEGYVLFNGSMVKRQ